MGRTRLTPYLLLAVLTLGAGLGIGLGLSEAPSITSTALSPVSTTSGSTHAATRHRAPRWLVSAIRRQLDTYPMIPFLGHRPPDRRRDEEVHYTETTGQTAWKAIGLFRGPVITDIPRVWLVVVTGPRDYEDIGAYVTVGQRIPSGTTIEFVFDLSGNLVATSAASDEEETRRVLSYRPTTFSAYALPVHGSALVGQPTPLVRHGHAGFGSCPSQTTEMTATVDATTLSQGQSLVANLVAKNLSRNACRFTGSSSATTGPRPQQEIGPCGAIPMEVIDSSGVGVWPAAVYSCQLLVPVDLGAGEQLSARGFWNATVPPGRYMVVVAGMFYFNVSIA